MNEKALGKEETTLLSYLLKTVPYDAYPVNPQPQSLHPFASSPFSDPIRKLADASASLSFGKALHSFTAFTSSVSSHIATLSSVGLASADFLNYQSEQDTRRRINALKTRDRTVAVYGEPIPLDRSQVVDWCIFRIEQWGKKMGMEIFKDEEKNGRMTVMLGGKVLVVEVDLAIQRGTTHLSESRISVSSVKTSHAMPSGSSGNALAERSASLDALILQTWNHYFAEVQSENVESNIRAAYMAEDIQMHLSYLMKLDVLAFQEGDQGLRWFNDTGLMSMIADQITKTEADSISSSVRSPTVNLDVFLCRAHALAVPYLIAPSMSFLIYLSPIAYYSLLRARESSNSTSNPPGQEHDAFSKLDIPVSVLRSQLTRKESRPAGVSIATLTLAPTSGSSAGTESRAEPRPHLGRPFFRLPGTALLAALDHSFTSPSSLSNVNLKSTRDIWILDFTNGGRSDGIVMTHSRMREIQQVLDPGSSIGGGMGLGMQIPPLPGSWVGLLINPAHPPSERYIAAYRSPSDLHPPLRLRLTVPNEAGFLLEKAPVRSLKEVYGILEIVRDQCWINETLKTVEWIAEDLMTDFSKDDSRGDTDTASSTDEELAALLNGNYRPRRIPVNVFLPTHPLAFPSSGTRLSDRLDPDAENAVPGLASISMSTGSTIPAPSVALAFTVHMPNQPGQSNKLGQVALVLRHDRTCSRGVRVDANVSVSESLRGMHGNHLPPQLIDELEEGARRGGAFGMAGKVWRWATGSG
ncbi:hypothetical protein EW145_g4857 [Phellinidium pouzarii]|uniref:Mediator complex subunit 1 n=1 Tax=Phellinidium pouzarii TaxID=167371 RepID=A0A4V6S157_9AGAM|nr:hypothetical protein EW145_g4857 [Phellinidium pouzarii]